MSFGSLWNKYKSVQERDSERQSEAAGIRPAGTGVDRILMVPTKSRLSDSWRRRFVALGIKAGRVYGLGFGV